MSRIIWRAGGRPGSCRRAAGKVHTVVAWSPRKMWKNPRRRAADAPATPRQSPCDAPVTRHQGHSDAPVPRRGAGERGGGRRTGAARGRDDPSQRIDQRKSYFGRGYDLADGGMSDYRRAGRDSCRSAAPQRHPISSMIAAGRETTILGYSARLSLSLKLATHLDGPLNAERRNWWEADSQGFVDNIFS